MEQEPIQSTPPNIQKALLGPWPWYVLLITGFALTGFFPWLMVSYAVYQREKKRTALLSFLVNFILFFAFSWVLLKSSIVWWWLVLFTYLFNVIWTLIAWLFQRKTIGSAAKRYVLGEWKAWITPVLIGVIIGVCMATVFSTIPAAQNRGVHLISGIVLFLGLWKPYRKFRKIHPLPPKQRGTYCEVIAGIVGGAFIGGLLGMVCTTLYLFFIDWLFSTLIPVTFEDAFAMYRLSTSVFFLILSGALAGGFIGRFRPRITAGQMFLYIRKIRKTWSCCSSCRDQSGDGNCAIHNLWVSRRYVSGIGTAF